MRIVRKGIESRRIREFYFRLGNIVFVSLSVVQVLDKVCTSRNAALSV